MSARFCITIRRSCPSPSGHPDIVTTHWPIRADLMTQPDLSAWSDLVDEPASLISRLAVSLARNFYSEICFYMVLVATLAIGLSIHLLRGRDIRSRYFSKNFRVDATYALLDVLHVSHFLVILPASIFIGELLRTTFPWLRVEAIASLPAWLQLFCLFVANDFCAYWLHRLHHGNPVFWQFHKTHHSQAHLSELTVFRVTVLDRLFDLLFLSLPLAVMGVGATAPIVMVTILQAHQLLIHSDTAISLGLLDRILVTPSFHEVHHSTAREHLDHNYGSVLSVWDHLFGTYVPRGSGELQYGLVEESIPESYLKQLVVPLTGLWSLASRRGSVAAASANQPDRVLANRPRAAVG